MLEAPIIAINRYVTNNIYFHKFPTVCYQVKHTACYAIHQYTLETSTWSCRMIKVNDEVKSCRDYM